MRFVPSAVHRPARLTRFHRRRSHGRTLLEVIVTLALLGIGAVLVAPMVRSAIGARREPERSADAFSTTLARARAAAAAANASVEVTLDPSSGRYWTTIGPGTDDARVTAGDLSIPAGVRIAAGDARPRFLFLPDGRALGDAIHFRGPRGVATVSVDLLFEARHALAR